MDVVHEKLQEYFACGPTKQYFEGEFGRCKKIPVLIDPEALVAGEQRIELKQKVTYIVDMARDWRNYPDMVLTCLRRAVDERHTMEKVDKVRAKFKRRPTANTKINQMNGSEPRVDGSTSTPASTKVCWCCYKSGNLRRDCPDPQNKAPMKDKSAQSSMGASGATGEQQAGA